jgi:XTP/dITP diphosphohydrolase
MVDAYEILIATRNAGKIEELREAFATLPLTLRMLDEFGNISEVSEVGTTYEENATLKAISYSRQTGITALADDSGLEVDALQGGPGVLSARFGGDNLSDVERTQALLATIQDVATPRRTARFVCCMVLYGWFPSADRESSARRVLAVTKGVCNGSLANQPKGTGGFGFDPIFIPDGYNLPFASLEPAIKRKISHRARAASLMRQRIDQQLTSNLTAGRTAS